MTCNTVTTHSAGKRKRTGGFQVRVCRENTPRARSTNFRTAGIGSSLLTVPKCAPGLPFRRGSLPVAGLCSEPSKSLFEQARSTDAWPDTIDDISPIPSVFPTGLW